jgi:ParB family chromosome partitioning protein
VAERGIGRGLAAILPSSQESADVLHQLPVELIRPNPRQPRGGLDDGGVRELAESIKEHGILQPVLVRPLAGSGYELIAGERRWRAARMAGLERVPALVRDGQGAEQLELALIENMAREDLNAVDAARACAALVEELDLTQEEVGRRVGRSRVSITNLIRLLDLPDDVLLLLERGELTEGHGRALLQARNAHVQRTLAREVCAKRLSVRETEALARSAQSGPRSVEAKKPGVALVSADAEAARQQAEDELSSALGRDVHVRVGTRGAKIEIPLEDLADALEIARLLRGRLAA